MKNTNIESLVESSLLKVKEIISSETQGWRLCKYLEDGDILTRQGTLLFNQLY